MTNETAFSPQMSEGPAIRQRPQLFLWLLLLAAIGLLAVVVSGFFAPQVFVSVCKIHVGATKANANPSGAPVSGAAQLHAQILSTQEVAIAASQTERIKERLAAGGFRCYPDAKEPKDLVNQLMAGVSVSSIAKTPNQLLLSFRCGDPEEAQILLGAVIEGYDDFLRQTYQSSTQGYTRQPLLAKPTRGIRRYWWQSVLRSILG